MPPTVDLRDLPQALSAAAKLPADLAPLTRRIAGYLDSIAAVPFGRRADPSTGRAWSPRKVRVPWSPLQHTGRLRASVRPVVLPPASVAWAFESYGRFHQQGGKRLPARPFVGFSREALREIDRITADFLARNLGK